MTPAAYARALTLLAVTLALALPVAGQDRVGLLFEPGDARSIGYSTNWAANLHLPPGGRVHQVALLDDLLLVVEPPGNVLTALSARTGELQWKRRLDQARMPLHQPLRLADTIIAHNEQRLYGLRAEDGREIFSINLDGPVVAPVVLYGRMALVPGAGGRLYTLDVAIGQELWDQRVPGDLVARPVITDEGIFVADTSGRYSLYGRDGRLRWQGRGFGRFEVTPAVGAGAVYLPGRDETLYAIDLATGEDRWRHIAQEPLTLAPSFIDDTVLLPVPRQSLVALEAESGQVRWRLAHPLRPVTRRDDGALVVGSPMHLELIDFDSGRSLAGAPAAAPLHRVLQGPDGSLIAVSAHGRILRLNRLR